MTRRGNPCRISASATTLSRSSTTPTRSFRARRYRFLGAGRGHTIVITMAEDDGRGRGPTARCRYRGGAPGCLGKERNYVGPRQARKVLEYTDTMEMRFSSANGVFERLSVLGGRGSVLRRG